MVILFAGVLGIVTFICGIAMTVESVKDIFVYKDYSELINIMIGLIGILVGGLFGLLGIVYMIEMFKF